MSTVIASHSNSQLVHITDAADPRGGIPVKTRCGRTLTNFWSGYFTDQLCPKCGTAADFAQVKTELIEADRAQKEREDALNAAAKARQAERLAIHRRLMGQFRTMMEEAGADVTEVKEMVAGGRIEFKIDGLKFEIHGNIW